MEIVSFKNFDEFKVYIKENAQKMKYWQPEQLQNFSDQVMALRESNPEFREKYDKWSKNLEAKQKKPLTIGGREEQTMSSRAKLKLRKIKEQKKSKLTPAEIAQRKKQYTI